MPSGASRCPSPLPCLLALGDVVIDDQAFICDTVAGKRVHPRAIRLHCGSGMGGARFSAEA